MSVSAGKSEGYIPCRRISAACRYRNGKPDHKALFQFLLVLTRISWATFVTQQSLPGKPEHKALASLPGYSLRSEFVPGQSPEIVFVPQPHWRPPPACRHVDPAEEWNKRSPTHECIGSASQEDVPFAAVPQVAPRGRDPGNWLASPRRGPSPCCHRVSDGARFRSGSKSLPSRASTLGSGPTPPISR